MTVGLALGLGGGDVIALEWDDVDLDARAIRIRWRVSRVKGTGKTPCLS